ncbi:MAG TPA: hypothetical protein VG098_04765 [Nitrososphaera sp.]|nr:hypothetical protein [Nitrososphaera sp.]
MIGVKAANAPWFDSDITNLKDSWNLVIHIAIGTTSVVQYTLDGGTNWINLNNGENLVARRDYTFIMQVVKDDAFNLRHTNTAAGEININIASLSYEK